MLSKPASYHSRVSVIAVTWLHTKPVGGAASTARPLSAPPPASTGPAAPPVPPPLPVAPPDADTPPVPPLVPPVPPLVPATPLAPPAPVEPPVPPPRRVRFREPHAARPRAPPP